MTLFELTRAQSTASARRQTFLAGGYIPARLETEARSGQHEAPAGATSIVVKEHTQQRETTALHDGSPKKLHIGGVKHTVFSPGVARAQFGEQFRGVQSVARSV